MKFIVIKLRTGGWMIVGSAGGMLAGVALWSWSSGDMQDAWKLTAGALICIAAAILFFIGWMFSLRDKEPENARRSEDDLPE